MGYETLLLLKSPKLFQRLVPNIADILTALIALMADHISLFLTHIHIFFNFHNRRQNC